MRALGVDPGTLATGYGIVDMKGNRLTHVGHGVIKTSPGAPLAARLVQIHQELVEVIAKYKPDEAGVENVFHAKNAQSALKLGHARGVILLAIELAGIPMEEYMPLQVKSAVVGYGKADKQQVQQMVMRLLALDKKAPTDASDALAVAICHSQSRGLKRAVDLASLSRRRR
jgi:crossover junction endodeoxyribonuclease RuvC